MLPKSEPAEFPWLVGTEKKKKKERTVPGWGLLGAGVGGNRRGDLGRTCKPHKFLLSLQNCR